MGGRRLALMLGIAVAGGLLLLAGWFGTRARPHADVVQPVPATGGEVSAAPVPEEPPPTARFPAKIQPPAEEEVAASLPSVTVPQLPELPPLPAAPARARDVDRKQLEGPPPPVGPQPLAPKNASPARLNDLSEDDLRKELLKAPELGLSPAARNGLIRSYKAEFQANRTVTGRIQFDPSILLKHFPQAGRLPLRSAPGCQLGPKEAATLGVLSRKLHAYLDGIAPKNPVTGKRTEPTGLREALRQDRRGQRPEWLRAEAVPTLLQILMAEDKPLRLMLVDLLAEIHAKAATLALARRAVFDLSPEVRQAAIGALRDRPAADYRPIFVDALRYPWPAPADHAAEALVALQDREAAPLLVALLGKPDPAAPYDTGKGDTLICQVIRVNHVANCLLCHAPAGSGSDPVVGVDPLTKRPNGGNISSTGGGWGSGGKSSGGGSVLVRPDVAFLRQDFSVSFEVRVPGIAADNARFDFLVYTRPATWAELRARKQKSPADPTGYSQRNAALFALRALTGQDPGPTTEAWLQRFPHALAEAEGVRLSTALVRSAPQRRDQLLARYRDGKDDRYTERLARAIPHLAGQLQDKARKALVERLSRLPADQLRARLQDDNAEVGRAAAFACVRKNDRELVPDLIELLLALEPEVATGAHETLQRLTGQDLGPSLDGDLEERAIAAAEWQAWWQHQATP